MNPLLNQSPRSSISTLSDVTIDTEIILDHQEVLLNEQVGPAALERIKQCGKVTGVTLLTGSIIAIDSLLSLAIEGTGRNGAIWGSISTPIYIGTAYSVSQVIKKAPQLNNKYGIPLIWGGGGLIATGSSALIYEAIQGNSINYPSVLVASSILGGLSGAAGYCYSSCRQAPTANPIAEVPAIRVPAGTTFAEANIRNQV